MRCGGDGEEEREHREAGGEGEPSRSFIINRAIGHEQGLAGLGAGRSFLGCRFVPGALPPISCLDPVASNRTAESTPFREGPRFRPTRAQSQASASGVPGRQTIRGRVLIPK